MLHTAPSFRRPLLLAGLAVLLGTSAVNAALPATPADRAAVVGEPAALEVQPAAITFTGPRSMTQIVVSGKYADGTVRDLTHLAGLSVEGGVVKVAGGFVTPVKDGSGALVISAGSKSVRVPVTVKEFDKPQRVSFRHEVIAALNVGGCNSGACHGTPSGKNGFKLSLRGYDPDPDHEQLTRDVLGRRTGSLNPDSSLIYLKALGRVPHEGGPRFNADSVPGLALRGWIAQGQQNDPATQPKLESIQVVPGNRLLKAPARWQQVAVQAKFSDGSVRDMTRLTNFSSSDPGVADVNANGLVEFNQTGEVAILCRYLDQLLAVRLTYLEPRPGLVWKDPPEVNYVDKHVFAKLKLLGIPPSDVCTDEAFLRRVYLDLLGVLPTPTEAQTFLSSKESDKRAKLIDKLLERPEYADFWALKWLDVLRSSRKTIQVKGTFVFQRWVRDHLERNTGFDKMVQEVLTAEGSTYANPPANYYRITRDPQGLAETTAQLFFGIRMQCAKCHNHPFERWTQDDYFSMAAFFAQVKQKKDPTQPGTAPTAPGAEVIYSARTGEVTNPRTGQVLAPRLPWQKTLTRKPGQSRTDLLAETLTAKDNPFFARATVNRIWFHLMGRGIVDPVDDFRDSNPPANDELLDALAQDFVKNNFDLKALIRTVLNSRTYQLSAQATPLNKDDNRYFSRAVTKMLPAEVLLDAICTATAVEEKFPGVPTGTRAVQLPDGESNHVFLKTFGQPGRELACECERESESNLAHALQLVNGQTIHGKLREANNRIGKLLTQKAPDQAMLSDLFLSTLSRPPTAKEQKLAADYLAGASDRRKAWEDLHWTLLNCKEFLFRH